MAKRALITGVNGQDGAYLARILLDKGYSVTGAVRRKSSVDIGRLAELGIANSVEFCDLELQEFGNIQRVIQQAKPDEIYNLAAQSFVALSFEEPAYTGAVDALGVTHILEAIRQFDKSIRYYQASTSEMFGRAREFPQSETTPFYPRSPYAIAKLYAHWMTINYRESYGLFACNGILFNHESPRRGETFVSRKITRAVARIHSGLQNKLYLGNLDAKRDWGYTPEYVEAMWRMMQLDEPDDFVVATGETHTVSEFVQTAFEYVGLDWRKWVEIDPRYFRPTEVDLLQGDASKARRVFGWEPKVKFEKLVRLMVDADLQLLQDQLQGRTARQASVAD